ncbi:MAG: MFS transporter [Methanomicrobiales archaeon]|jgi:EmrB/QacA subfamily drug resistance transporter|nr:MFS transporter [Methanomicrobiales archaeon]
MGTATARNGFTLLIISISLAAFMTALDGTIVNIALPTISEAFDLSTSTVSWVSTIYLLVISGCILIFGKVSDGIGFRKVFLWGFLLFSAGSLFCGLLPDLLGSFPVLIGSRAFQAVGAAMIAAIGPAMVTAFFPMEQKGKAMGIVLTFSSIGTIVGPAIGGVLCQYLSWNWIFFINIPVGIVAILLGAKVIPTTRLVKRTGGFDRAGATLIFVGLASLLFALSEGQAFGWTAPAIIMAFALAMLTLGGFIYCELRSPDPLLDLRLFTRRNFLMTNVIIALIFFSYGGLNYLLPFYLEYVQHYVPSAAGLILTALSVTGGIAGILAGVLYNRTGGRLLCILAGISIAAGFLMLTLIRVDTSTGFVVVCLSLIGFGIGLMLTPASNMIMNSVARKYQGMVSGLIIVERFAPMSMGIALFNLVFIQGVIKVAAHNEITRTAPVNIRIETLMTGFDLAFFFAFLIGVIILILAFVARQETHSDYQQGADESLTPPAL